MGNKLQKIDEHLRTPAHDYLEDGDECLFYGEYTAGGGFGHSETNQLVFNFKKSVEKRDTKEWIFKQRAVKKVAEIFLKLEIWEQLKLYTWVPIPPSKSINDPLYDDRLIQTLKIMKASEPSFDYRELVKISQSRKTARDSDSRPTPEDHYGNYELDRSLLEPKPEKIVIYDDVITTGSGYKAMKRMIKENFVDTEILGIFIARTVHDI